MKNGGEGRKKQEGKVIAELLHDLDSSQAW